MNDEARRRRREEARRRVYRRRRLVAAGVAGLVVVLLVAGGLLAFGGDGGGDSEAEAPPKPPSLPRGGRTILPDFRVVAYYGAPQDDELGILGIGPPRLAARRLEPGHSVRLDLTQVDSPTYRPSNLNTTFTFPSGVTLVLPTR